MKKDDITYITTFILIQQSECSTTLRSHTSKQTHYRHVLHY